MPEASSSPPPAIAAGDRSGGGRGSATRRGSASRRSVSQGEDSNASFMSRVSFSDARGDGNQGVLEVQGVGRPVAAASRVVLNHERLSGGTAHWDEPTS